MIRMYVLSPLFLRKQVQWNKGSSIDVNVRVLETDSTQSLLLPLVYLLDLGQAILKPCLSFLLVTWDKTACPRFVTGIKGDHSIPLTSPCTWHIVNCQHTHVSL